MPASFWNIVNLVIEESDILLEVLDARFIEQTRNHELEKKIAQKGKALIFVINKCDLAERAQLGQEKKKLKHAVFVSAREHHGTLILYKKILSLANTKYPEKEKIIIGVVGYPNTGKSSIINALKGKHSARTSPISGFTQAKQLLKISDKIYLLDTPGVLSYEEKDERKLALTGSLDANKMNDPESVVLQIMDQHPEIALHYNVEEDPEAALEMIAKKMNLLLKGGKPDTVAAAKRILKEIQIGKIKILL